MTVDLGLGLLLNVLVWTAAVLIAVGLASLAVIEFFPGRDRAAPKGSRGGRGGAPAVQGGADADDAAERYRKAS